MDRNLACCSRGSFFKINSAPQCKVMPHSRGRVMYVSDVSRSNTVHEIPALGKDDQSMSVELHEEEHGEQGWVPL